jgi:hypothetical protein
MKSKETDAQRQLPCPSQPDSAAASQELGDPPELPAWRVPSGPALGEFALRSGFVAGRLLKPAGD